MKEEIGSRKVRPYTVISPIVVLIAVCVSWFILYAQGSEIQQLPDPVDGISDASQMNLNETVGAISKQMEFYPLKLYAPSDFLSGEDLDAQSRDEIENASSIYYGTYRTKLMLLPNTYYSICGYSLDYGTKVFANGQEVYNVGVVSKSPSESVPNVNYMDFPVYTGDDGIVELVLQYSNFVHEEGGDITSLYIGSPIIINDYMFKLGLPTYIVSGGFILLATYYLLDGILRKRKISLQLSLACLLFALRDQWFYIVSILPIEYDWYVHYRIMVAIVVITPVVVLTLIQELYPKVVPYVWTYLFSTVSFAVTALLLLVPTNRIMTLMFVVPLLAVPYSIYLTYKIIKYYKEKPAFSLKDIYTISGISVLFVCTVLDTGFSTVLPEITRGGLTPIGMFIFVIILMAVLALQSEEDEVALEKSKALRKSLESINTMKTDFLQKMAHEIKTPLTVMSGYAQLTNLQIENNEVDDETSANLNIISSEARRLASLVSNLMEMPTDTEEVRFNEIVVSEYLKYCKVMCKSVLEKNNNSFIVNGEANVSILGNMEMLIQLMLNLALNSNKHMKNGEFSVSLTENSDNIEFLISDTGKGIEKENAKFIFARGYSTGGTKGLGLPICREIAELHKGDLVFVHSELGAKFKLILPKVKEENNG